ncbi:MAG: hypothetical protein Ct9H300mP28_18020 [Pseudomonadota bacterium]|nr:MAG: hypothetical protein Ct9H300mP28_18020 [Pseudomonadota bacterium]
MEAFETLSGKAVPLDIINVDTDQIIPKQFLKKIDRAGLVFICFMTGVTWMTQVLSRILSLYSIFSVFKVQKFC